MVPVEVQDVIADLGAEAGAHTHPSKARLISIWKKEVSPAPAVRVMWPPLNGMLAVATAGHLDPDRRTATEE